MSSLVLPPATIGIVGGGQLGMMTIREAQRMGYRSAVWDPDPDCPAFRLADVTVAAPFKDRQAAERLASESDVMTYEFEHVDPDLIEWLGRQKPLFPGGEILRVSRHRCIEKQELQKRGFPVVEYSLAATSEEIRSAVRALGLPVVVKTASTGYDGKGQVVVRETGDLEEFLGSVSGVFPECVVERFIPLRCEISVIAVRGKDGSVSTFPLAENEHRDNILHVTRIPARVSGSLEVKAIGLAKAIVESFQLIGVLCVEMFVTNDGEVLVNELAPRPHNSGHFSLDACSVSQFEALIRSMCGIPLQQPTLLTPCAMVNLLGKHLQRIDLRKAQALEGTKVHLYGKRRLEAKRKMGHITVLGNSPENVEQKVISIEEMIGEGHPRHQEKRRDKTLTAL